MSTSAAPTAAVDTAIQAAAIRRTRRMNAHALAVPQGQLDMFGDDPFEIEVVLDQTIEASIDAEVSVEIALAANPSILSPELSPAQRDEAKQGLDFARFMRTAGIPTPAVRAALIEASLPADATLARLAAVEEVVGAGAIDFEDSDDDEVAAELGADSEAEQDEDGATKAKSKRGAAGAGSSSAFSALMKDLGGARYEPPSEEQVIALAARIQQGDQAARNELVERNMRFLVSAAQRFRYTNRNLDELVAMGQEGLIRAAELFNPSEGAFTTYARSWIRQKIQRALNKDGIFKTPANLSTKVNKLHAAAEAAAEGDEKVRLTAIADSARRELNTRRASHVSMDGDKDDDDHGGGGLHNMFASEAQGPEELLETRKLIGWIVTAAEEMENDRSGAIFKLRMGLHEEHYGDPQTLAAVAERFDISVERVRQVYVEAAREVANTVELWARGADNLPAGFRKGLMKPPRT